jgi:hypothetical protein
MCESSEVAFEQLQGGALLGLFASNLRQRDRKGECLYYQGFHAAPRPDILPEKINSITNNRVPKSCLYKRKTYLCPNSRLTAWKSG